MAKNKQTLDVMLGLALQNLSNMIEFCDVNGYGQKSETLDDARKFCDEFLLYVRYRPCCANCAHYGVPVRGKPGKKCLATAKQSRVIGDPGTEVCKMYACRYEDIRKKRVKTFNRPDEPTGNPLIDDHDYMGEITVRQILGVVNTHEFPKGLDTRVIIGDVEGNLGFNSEICLTAHKHGDIVLSVDPNRGKTLDEV